MTDLNRSRGIIAPAPLREVRPEGRRPAAQEPPVTAEARILHRRAWLFGGLALALAIYAWHCYLFRLYVSDDAFITLRYSRFLGMGRGPYFNIGEHVEGYTNFLMMLIMTPVIAVAGEAAGPMVAKALGVLGGAAGLCGAALLAWRLCRSDAMSRQTWIACGLLAAAIVAVNPAFAVNSTSGLETTLYCAFITGGVWLALRGCDRGRWYGAGVVFAAAALTRPEGAAVFAVHWCVQGLAISPRIRGAFRAWRRDGRGALKGFPEVTRCWIRDAVIVAGACLAHLAFRLFAYDGEWLPNTYYAKLGGAWWGGGAATYIAECVFPALLGPIGLGAACLGCLVSRATLERRSWPVLAVAIVGTLLPLLTGTDWMMGYRLIAPFLPVIAACAAWGWCRLVAIVLPRSVWFAPLLLALLPPTLWVRQQEPRSVWIRDAETLARGNVTGHAALADWLRNGAVQPGGTVALMDVGLIGYRCIDQRILDTSGLTDRYIARCPGRFLDKNYDIGYVLERRPDYVILVLSASGDPRHPLPVDAKIGFWTPIEMRIWQDPRFQATYCRRRPAAESEHWTERLARQVGAERVFPDAHPDRYFMLAAFRRHTEARRG